MYRDVEIQGQAQLWLNLHDDLRDTSGLFKGYVNTTRTDLTNVEDKGTKRYVYLRGNVSF